MKRPKWGVWSPSKGSWYWHLRAANGKIIATCGESFVSRRNAIRALRNVKRICGYDVLVIVDEA